MLIETNTRLLADGDRSLDLLRSVPFSSLLFDIPVTATLDARGYLAWTLLGLFSFFDHYIQSSAPSQASIAF